MKPAAYKNLLHIAKVIADAPIEGEQRLGHWLITSKAALVARVSLNEASRVRADRVLAC